MTPAKANSAPHGKPETSKAATKSPAADPLTEAADALFRAAIEASRQHERVARLSRKSCTEGELVEMAELCETGHRHLAARTNAWEQAASVGQGKHDDAFWHAANTLWHASREYSRRHNSCDALTTKVSRRSTDALGALTMEYELEASALLALTHAVGAYRRLRADAE